MMECRYQQLERFETKKPDYDLRERKDAALREATYEPARYEKTGENRWKAKNRARGLFRKKKARIMFTGDITCFEKQFEQAEKGDGYDFSYEFDKVRPVFEQADLVVGNLETSIFPEAPYRIEKYVSEMQFHCNAPIEFLDAVRRAGFDMVTNANNHAMDTGAIGIGETIGYIERFGLMQTGCFNREKKHYELVEVCGFKVAIVAMATEYNGKKENLTGEGQEFLLNYYTKEKAELLLNQARAEGAEVVFMCIHWGKENKLITNKAQRLMAREIARLGYDCIIGSHPHVLQPFRRIKIGERSVPVFYSLGNFISHNSGNDKGRTIIPCIDLERDGAAVRLTCTYIPAYTSNVMGKRKYVAVPLKKDFSDAASVRNLEKIVKVVGDEIEITEDVNIKESHETKVLAAAKKAKKKKTAAPLPEGDGTYDDGSFTYVIENGIGRVTGFSAGAKSLSYTVPGDLGDIPVIDIEEGALAGNTTIKKINFSRRTHDFKPRICRNCTALEGYQTSRQAYAIGEEAFAGCTALQAVVMRKKMKRIGSRAYAGCTALRSVKIPPNVDEIAADAFEGCTGMTIYCEKDSYAEQYAKEHDIPFINMTFEL